MDEKIAEGCHDILRGVLNVLEKESNDQEKDRVSKIIAEQVNRFLSFHKIGEPLPTDDTIERDCETIKDQGYVALKDLLNEKQIDEIRSHFESLPTFNGHIMGSSDKVPRSLKEARQYPFAVYRREDVLSAPHLMRLANSPRILSLIKSYLGCVPTIYSINAFWSFSGSSEQVDDAAKYTQYFHQDRDDFKFCTLFVFLTDVNMENGPHQYIRTSHRHDDFIKFIREENPSTKIPIERLYTEFFKDEVLEKFPVLNNMVDNITGKAGSGFIGDQVGLHRGLPPAKGERLLLWFRYGLYYNASDPSPKPSQISKDIIPDNNFLDKPMFKYINRILVK